MLIAQGLSNRRRHCSLLTDTDADAADAVSSKSIPYRHNGESPPQPPADILKPAPMAGGDKAVEGDVAGNGDGDAFSPSLASDLRQLQQQQQQHQKSKEQSHRKVSAATAVAGGEDAATSCGVRRRASAGDSGRRGQVSAATSEQVFVDESGFLAVPQKRRTSKNVRFRSELNHVPMSGS